MKLNLTSSLSKMILKYVVIAVLLTIAGAEYLLGNVPWIAATLHVIMPIGYIGLALYMSDVKPIVILRIVGTIFVIAAIGQFFIPFAFTSAFLGVLLHLLILIISVALGGLCWLLTFANGAQ